MIKLSAVDIQVIIDSLKKEISHVENTSTTVSAPGTLAHDDFEAYFKDERDRYLKIIKQLESERDKATFYFGLVTSDNKVESIAE